MNTNLIFLSFRSLLEPIVISAVLTSLAGTGTLIFAYSRKEANLTQTTLSVVLYYFLFGIPISLLAYVTGYLTSISRTAVVGTVLPAVLTLVGGVNIYVFGSDSRYKIVVGFCVALFTVTLFYGVQRGALEREVGRETRLTNLSEQERRIRNYREFRGLPAEFPSWMISGEPK